MNLLVLHPFAGPRVMHVSNMLLQAQQWIEKTHPAAWKRRGGRDHIWLSPNDEGAAKSCRVRKA